MTARIGTLAVDGTPISEADLARVEAEEKLHAQWRSKAVRVVAAVAVDVADCRQLLDMLGLDPRESGLTSGGKAARKGSTTRTKAGSARPSASAAEATADVAAAAAAAVAADVSVADVDASAPAKPARKRSSRAA